MLIQSCYTAAMVNVDYSMAVHYPKISIDSIYGTPHKKVYISYRSKYSYLRSSS